EMSAAQRKHLPPEDRRVSELARRVAPAASDRVLCIDDELNGALGWTQESGVARESVALADGHGRDRMAIQVRHPRRPHEQVAVGLLMSNQPIQSLPDCDLMAALDGVGVAGPQQRQQSQTGRRGVGLDRTLERTGRVLTLLLKVHTPRPVVALV